LNESKLDVTVAGHECGLAPMYRGPRRDPI
jgi:hypothetical protein